LTDFAAEELLIGLCSEGVPCGDLGRRILEEAGVTAVVDSNEPNVRALLTKIEVGELDAGLVYVTDVPSAGGGVDGVEIAGIDDVIAEYPIVVLRGARNPDGAEAFVAFVLSDEGSAILREHGFSTP
jgi:molybdate transport system substrate-binding protein